MHEKFNVENHAIESDFEVCAVKLLPSKVVIVSVYCAESYNLSSVTALEKMLDSLVNSNYKFFILGDFNIDIRKDKPIVHTLLNILRSYDAYCLFSQNTRKKSCIDNVITNCNFSVLDKDVIKSCIADHDMLWVNINSSVINVQQGQKHEKCNDTISFRNLSNHNLNNFRSKLSTENWCDIYSKQTVDEISSEFVDRVIFHYNNTCPIRPRLKCKSKGRKKKSTKWFTPQLAQLREWVTILRDRSSLSPENQQLFKKARCLYRKEIKFAKINFNEKLILN